MDLNHLTHKVSRYMSSQTEYSGILNNMTNPVENVRLELTILCLQSIRSCHLSYTPPLRNWQDLNLRPSR